MTLLQACCIEEEAIDSYKQLLERTWSQEARLLLKLVLVQHEDKLNTLIAKILDMK